MPITRPRPVSPASWLIHASVAAKVDEPEMPLNRRSTNQAPRLSNGLSISASSGWEMPMPMPNTAIEEMAAARLQRRSDGVMGISEMLLYSEQVSQTMKQ